MVAQPVHRAGSRNTFFFPATPVRRIDCAYHFSL